MTKSFKTTTIILVIIATVAVFAAVAVAGTFASWRTTNGVVIQKSGDAFLKQGASRTIKAPDLTKLMTDTDTTGNLVITNDPLILDVRSIADYNACHIPDAIWIAPYDQMAETQNLDTLDAALVEHIKRTGCDDIVVYCHTGHTAGLTTGVLGAIGYDVKNLRFGYNVGWKSDKTKVTGINTVPGDCESVLAP